MKNKISLGFLISHLRYENFLLEKHIEESNSIKIKESLNTIDSIMYKIENNSTTKPATSRVIDIWKNGQFQIMELIKINMNLAYKELRNELRKNNICKNIMIGQN